MEIYFYGEQYGSKMFHPDAIASGDLNNDIAQLKFDIGISQVDERQKALTGTGKVELNTIFADLPLNHFVKPGKYAANMNVYLSY